MTGHVILRMCRYMKITLLLVNVTMESLERPLLKNILSTGVFSDSSVGCISDLICYNGGLFGFF